MTFAHDVWHIPVGDSRRVPTFKQCGATLTSVKCQCPMMADDAGLMSPDASVSQSVSSETSGFKSSHFSPLNVFLLSLRLRCCGLCNLSP